MSKLAYTVQELAKSTSIGEKEIRLAVRSGELKTVKIGHGGKRVVPASVAVAWLDRRAESDTAAFLAETQVRR